MPQARALKKDQKSMTKEPALRWQALRESGPIEFTLRDDTLRLRLLLEKQSRASFTICD